MSPLARTTRSLVKRHLPAPVRDAILARTKYQRLRRTEAWGYSLQPFDRHRCIYVHIPKTGGVSVAKALFGNYGAGHVPITMHRRIFGDALFEQYFKFTFVRNPWDRVVSAYTFLRKGGMDREDKAFAARHIAPYADFDQFVRCWLSAESARRSLHFRPQSDWLCLRDGTLGVDYIGRFERLAEDFKVVCEQLGIQANLAHHNASQRHDYRQYYTGETAAIVGEVYQRDIALLDYAFDPAALPTPPRPDVSF